MKYLVLRATNADADADANGAEDNMLAVVGRRASCLKDKAEMSAVEKAALDEDEDITTPRPRPKPTLWVINLLESFMLWKRANSCIDQIGL